MQMVSMGLGRGRAALLAAALGAAMLLGACGEEEAPAPKIGLISLRCGEPENPNQVEGDVVEQLSVAVSGTDITEVRGTINGRPVTLVETDGGQYVWQPAEDDVPMLCPAALDVSVEARDSRGLEDRKSEAVSPAAPV